jgi:hypothetical protein
MMGSLYGRSPPARPLPVSGRFDVGWRRAKFTRAAVVDLLVKSRFVIE